jgi:anaerobic selenocysteine-containing dehydrogenase
MCIWLINILNIITNNCDKIGGAMFTLPAIDLVGMSGMQGKTGTFNRYQSTINKLPEYSGEFPVATLADEILNESENQIKAFVSIAGNPVLSTPNGKKLEKALEKLEFMVSIDIYLNETSKYADIILPTTTGLETAHYDLAFHQLAIRNTAKFSDSLFKKTENQRHDWQVLNELTQRITKVKNSATPEMMLDFMLQYSPYKSSQLSVKKIKNNPNGIDFGALKPCLTNRIFTEDKKINLTPKVFIEDINRIKIQLENWKIENSNNYPFCLIGRRQLRNNNSWMHNSQILIKGRNRCTLLINNLDADKLKIENNQLITIISDVGKVKIPVEITKKIKQGVLSIPHGFGHHRKGIKMELAQQNAGVSINDLTNDKNIDQLTGNANFSGTKVRIEL